jgi:RNA polymerase sigma factor (sigma-70 family)
MQRTGGFLLPHSRPSAFEILAFSKFQKNGGNAMSRRRTKAEEIRNPEHYFNRYVACERKKEQEEDAEYYNLHCSLDELSEQAAAGFNHDFAYFFSVNRENEDMERLYAKKNVFGWIDQIENQKLQKAVAQLPADKKLLLTLRYQYRKTQREVAQIMNIKQSSVCERENRILKEIKKMCLSA